MIELIVEFVASKIADQVLDGVIEAFRKRLDDEYRILNDRLAALDAKVDAQLLTPLRAGLTFLQLGKTEAAMEEFVRAEALDPYAAASKLCLGLTLRKLGQAANGAQFIKESLRLNPYIVKGLVALPELPSVPLPSQAGAVRRLWQVSLLDESVRATLPSKPIRLPGFFARRASSAVRSVSTNALHPVVNWILGGDLRDSPEEFVSVFDSERGTCMWSRSLQGSSLYLVAPQFVILMSGDVPPIFKLLSIDDGSMLRAMSTDYFHLAFMGGNHKTLPDWSFGYFGRAMMPLTDAYAQTKVEYTEKGFRGLIKGSFRIFSHDYRCVLEREIVPGPVSPTQSWFIVENEWSHAHVSYGQYGAACGLWGSSKIGRDVATNSGAIGSY